MNKQNYLKTGNGPTIGFKMTEREKFKTEMRVLVAKI